MIWHKKNLSVYNFFSSKCANMPDSEISRLSAAIFFSFKLWYGNVHKGRPTIMGHFGHTYLPISDVFYTMPITLVRFLLRYLPTPKLDVLYEGSLMGSTNQADPSCFYFRISWILMEWLWFHFFVPSTCCRASESKIDYFNNLV